MGGAEAERAGLLAEITRLQAANAALEEAVAARDAFLVVAAHELRNPMAPIGGQTERLLTIVRAMDDAPPRLIAGLERLTWIVKRFMRRATTLLDASRAASGHLRQSRETVLVTEVMDEVVQGLEPIAAYNRCVVQVRAPSPGPVLEADRMALDQIFDNLVSNAIKYGEGKPVEVDVAESGSHVMVRVRDHGPGISPADRTRIFLPFERVISDTPRSGFGVGLWLVRQLVEGMGGSIGIDEAAGGGSVFAVSLPKQSGFKGT